jgi:hypothetical protein
MINGPSVGGTSGVVEVDNTDRMSSMYAHMLRICNIASFEMRLLLVVISFASFSIFYLMPIKPGLY